MVNVAEHVYHDDPGVGHPDVRTRLAGASYFFLGNGAIQAAVQVAPDGEGTPLGLLVMDPERLGKKRDALTMSEAHGLEATVVSLETSAGVCAPHHEKLRAAWIAGTDVPTVEARWPGPALSVIERFSCPADSVACLLREVTIGNTADVAQFVTLRTGPPDRRLEQTVPVEAGADAQVRLMYELAPSGLSLRVGPRPADPAGIPSSLMWAGRSTIVFHDTLLDSLFNAARWQLPAAVSARGRLDGSIWQYNREWVRDQACVALALTQLGHWSLGATILRRLLGEFVTPEGATLDSSEVRSRDDVELDQNGILLWVLEQYVHWTGDRDLVAGAWPKVEALANYPLRDEFRHRPSGMLSGSREYWERHAAHGIEPGLELVYQVFVSLGLESAGALARMLGHAVKAPRWQEASHDLRRALTSHPVYALQSGGRLIKRRRLDGRVQEHIVARPDSGLPAGVPLASDRSHRLNPDTCTVLPIVFGVVDPGSPLAQATLDSMETLWNQAWSHGGYGRYDVSSEPDSPGAWPFASLFVARAAAEAGRSASVWRTLRWMQAMAGGAGSWFEFYGTRLAPPFPQVGIVPWTWAELVLLFVHHILGVRPGGHGIYLRPRLLAGLRHVEARLPIGAGWLDLTLRADESAPPISTVVASPVGRTRLTLPVKPLS